MRIFKREVKNFSFLLKYNLLTFVNKQNPCATRVIKNVYTKYAIFISVLFLYKYERYLIKKRNMKMARVLISMPEDFLTRIDEVAEGENRTRSELIREALRTYIHKQKVKENALAMKNASILETLLD